MSKLASEFKEFIMQGNVIDMAVGVVIGGAFKSVIDSLVNDVIMPPIGLLIGGVNFNELKIVLKAAQGDVPEVAISYGLLINAIVSFLLIALVIFLVIKGLGSMRDRFSKKEEEAPAEPEVTDVVLLTQILDELKRQNGTDQTPKV